MVPTFVVESFLAGEALAGGKGREAAWRAVSAAAATAAGLEGIGGLYPEDRAEPGAASGPDSRGGCQPFAKEPKTAGRLQEVSQEMLRERLLL